MTLQNGLLNKNKKLILITGTSTAGKSTVAQALTSEAILDDIFIIPQATIRKSRKDDDPRFILSLPESDYFSETFFSCHGHYGILKKSYDNFINSNCNVGISVISDLDMVDFSMRHPNVDLYRVVLTITDSIEEEKEAINKRIPLCFSKEKINDRISLMAKIAERSYFNEAYMSKYADLHLTHKNDNFISWISKISDIVSLKKSQILKRHALIYCYHHAQEWKKITILINIY